MTLVEVVAIPDNAPENVVADTVPVDGFIKNVDTEDVAEPDAVPVAVVNVIGWLKLEAPAATTLTLLDVDA